MATKPQEIDERYIYIVSSYWAPDIGMAESNLIVATHDSQEAHDVLVREVRDYIMSWHEGDNVECRTKESYFNDGFTKDGTAYCLSDQPCKVERWVLEESDTYMEFSITRMRIGNNKYF